MGARPFQPQSRGVVVQKTVHCPDAVSFPCFMTTSRTTFLTQSSIFSSRATQYRGFVERYTLLCQRSCHDSKFAGDYDDCLSGLRARQLPAIDRSRLFDVTIGRLSIAIPGALSTFALSTKGSPQRRLEHAPMRTTPRLIPYGRSDWSWCRC
jgi:hypothetical protein